MDQRTANEVSQRKSRTSIVILVAKEVMQVGHARSCSACEILNSFSNTLIEVLSGDNSMTVSDCSIFYH